jgi:hypothetical protein
MGGAFQVSLSNGSYVFGVFETTHTNPSTSLTNDKPCSFPVKSNCNIQKKIFKAKSTYSPLHHMTISKKKLSRARFVYSQLHLQYQKQAF